VCGVDVPREPGQWAISDVAPLVNAHFEPKQP
jgi:hypothetical protein